MSVVSGLKNRIFTCRVKMAGKILVKSIGGPLEGYLLH